VVGIENGHDRPEGCVDAVAVWVVRAASDGSGTPVDASDGESVTADSRIDDRE